MAKKPVWLFRQSAVIPYIITNGKIEIVLITSSNHNWIIPKGVVERFMTPENSALMEAQEEAGVLGNVSSEVFSEYDYEKWGGICHVQVFLMEVTEILDSWQEIEKRERIVVSVPKAIELVKSDLKEIIREFYQLKVINKTNNKPPDALK